MKTLLTILAALVASVAVAQRPNCIRIEFPNDRTILSDSIPLTDIDSVVFFKTYLYAYKNGLQSKYKSYPKDAEFNFNSSKSRAIVIPNTYQSVNFSLETSRFCFQRSQESEHFICFWEKGLTKTASGNISLGGYTVNVPKLLSDAEKIWNVYVNDLGFIVPGSSSTDKVKIEMFIVNQSDWRADGSGDDGTVYSATSSGKTAKSQKVGLFHCTPQAATARNGHTLAHEIGHTFQYLTGVDCGSTHGLNYVLGSNSKGNEWWEDCANWQAYKVYPSYQFTDGEYFENYMNCNHLNIHHEASRYHNCFYHDWWCHKHGKNTIGRIWREAVKPADPTQTYMKLFNLNEESFADEQFDGYMHFTSIDIDGVRDYGKSKIGRESQRLIEVPQNILDSYLDGDRKWWIVDPAYCVQNYGYNANPLKVPAEGTTIKASFKGLAGAPGYRNINGQYAGWRYGIAAYCNDGTRVYSDIKKDSEGEVTMTVPANCKHMWFVVMGAPTKYWTHSWDDDESNDEQWPYAVKFEGTDPAGVLKTYGEFPADYARHDTTIVINATLAYNSSSYTYVKVQYDMNAISEALGLSTAQLKTVKRNDSVSNAGDIRFAGVNSNGTTLNYYTTTSTSGDKIYGHWFNASSNVCNYDSSAMVYAEMNPDNYVCSVGQYPGRLARGKTYKIRQAIVYTHTNNKLYKAIIEVNLKIE